jgi:hypothetical protein
MKISFFFKIEMFKGGILKKKANCLSYAIYKDQFMKNLLLKFKFFQYTLDQLL